MTRLYYKMMLATVILWSIPVFFISIHRFDLYGIYVVMFLEILKTLVQVTLVFSFLLIAFGLAFYVLMYSDVSFHVLITLMINIVKVFRNITSYYQSE